MLSHVTNKAVLETARVAKLSSVLLERQLKLMGTIAQLPQDSAVRAVVFKPNTFSLFSLPGKGAEVALNSAGRTKSSNMQF